MTFAGRLKQLRIEYGLTQEELANALNISKGTIGMYEIDKRKPDTDMLKEIANYFKVSIDYLLCNTDFRENDLPRNAFTTDDYLAVPILGTIRAGEPIYAEVNIIGHAPVPKFMISSGEHFYLKVIGDSMNMDNIVDGGYVLVRRQDMVENGETAVIIVDGDEATIKKFYRTDTTVTLMPKSSNPLHQPIVIDIRKISVKVVGKVVYSLTKI